MTFQEYRALGAANWSSLRELARSPKHYAYRLSHERPDTPAMRLGRAVHTSVLEPDRFALEYTIWRGGVRRGKEWDAFCVANDDKDILSEDEYARCVAIRDAVRGHPVAGPLLANGVAETTLQWVDSATGLALKARLDYLTDTALVDLKTAQSVTPRDFARACTNYQYHGQLAFYARPVEVPKVYMVAVESEQPHDVVVYEPDDDFLWAGDELVTDLLAKLKTCTDTDTWPGMYSGVQPLSLPAWVYSELEDATSLGVSFRKGDA
jgi:exodeoxyribonuclease VIII